MSLALALCLTLSLLPAVSVSAAGTIYAEPYFENPEAGSAIPASPSGATAAVAYAYSGVSLRGEEHSWFFYDSDEPLSFAAVFTEPMGISDYGEVAFNATTAPYITYTPSAQVAGQTVKFKVEASAASAPPVTGNFFWTVKVAAQPTDGSSNANLSALGYTLGAGEMVAVPGFSADITGYNVTLPYGTQLPQTAVLSGTVADTGKASISSKNDAMIANYAPCEASITVRSENGATTKTYRVNFQVAPPEQAPSVSIGSTVFRDGDTIALAANEEKRLTVSLGSGSSGAVSAAYKSSNWDKLPVVGAFEGVYPNVTNALKLQLNETANVDLTISFYDVKQAQQKNATPISTMTLHIVADGKAVNVSTAAAFATALEDDHVEQIQISGLFTYDGAIGKKVAIHVQRGSTLTLNYATNSATMSSTVCNADITVESGGTLCFKSTAPVSSQDYFVMQGDFTLNEGARATTATNGFKNSILLQGDFTNNGSFDVAKGHAFVPYGATDTGTFTNGAVCYNLCITKPTKTSTSDAKLYTTGVAGTVAIGEKLHPILDGLGEIATAIPGLEITWGDSSSGGSTFEYTVPPAKAGATITVRVNGSPQNVRYAYFLVDGAIVTKVTTPDTSGYTTEKVKHLNTIYLGGAGASDSNSGASADKAVATVTAALSAVADGGKIVLCGNVVTAADGFLPAKGSVTITNTDGTNTYRDAVLTLNGAQFPLGNITFENIRLAKGAAEQSGILVPAANNTSLAFDNVTATDAGGAPISFSIQNAYASTGVTAAVRDCTLQLYIADIETLTLDHATVISNFDTETPLGSVSLTKESTLVTPQIIHNLTSDHSDNALALFSSEGTPVAVTVNGTVHVAAEKPITLLSYTGSGYEAFAADGLRLITSSVENTSLTADKFITIDTDDYSLKKDGNNIITEQKPVVTRPSGGYTPPTVTVPVTGSEGTVSVSAIVSGSTAVITMTEQQLAAVVGNAVSTDTVTVDMSGLQDVNSAKIPAKFVTAIHAASGLTVMLSTAAVKLDETALASAAAANADITVAVEPVKANALTTAQKAALEGKLNSAVVLDIHILANGVQMTQFGGGVLTVSIPYTPKTGENTAMLTIWCVGDDGTVEKMSGHYDAANKRFVFDTTHLSRYALVFDANANAFTDVPADAYYQDAVVWAVSRGVFSGTSATTFSPDADMTRAMLWTTLARLDGQDTEGGASWYEKAQLWAIEMGISDGSHPDGTITRDQLVTTLYRYAQSKNAALTADMRRYTDGDTVSDWAMDAFAWAITEGIVAGTSPNTLSPKGAATRAEVVTVLHRFAAPASDSKPAV